jgi:SAM-dependent methyltransferase
MPDNAAIFDRHLLALRRKRAQRLGVESFLLDHVTGDLADRLSVVLRQFGQAADIDTPADALRNSLVERKFATHASAAGIALQGGVEVVVDAEGGPLAEGSLDLAVSALSLHFVNDLPGTLIQIRRALKPDGLFLCALLGGETLTELRQSFAAAESEIEGGASPHVAPFADLRDLGALLQRAGFALPVTDLDRLIVRYADAFSLMRDLRRMGATNVLSERRRKPMRRATLFRMAEIYREQFSDPDGRLRATFDIVWLSGWAPHESQQQPLKPGSARMRLADALKTSEIPAGEKAGR